MAMDFRGFRQFGVIADWEWCVLGCDFCFHPRSSLAGQGPVATVQRAGGAPAAHGIAGNRIARSPLPFAVVALVLTCWRA